MGDESIKEYIIKNQLTSFMNNTKWRELVAEITSDPEFDPPVKIKYVIDENCIDDFAPVWWDEVEEYGFNSIEWIEIKPKKELYIGKLVNPKIIDYSNFIKQGLEKHSIPFEYNNEIFKIYGYKR